MELKHSHQAKHTQGKRPPLQPTDERKAVRLLAALCRTALFLWLTPLLLSHSVFRSPKVPREEGCRTIIGSALAPLVRPAEPLIPFQPFKTCSKIYRGKMRSTSRIITQNGDHRPVHVSAVQHGSPCSTGHSAPRPRQYMQLPPTRVYLPYWALGPPGAPCWYM